MATTNYYKQLGAEAVTADTDTLLYTVPANGQAIVASVFICNRDPSNTNNFRLYHIKNGGVSAVEDKYALYYDEPIAPSDSFAVTCGISMAPNDSLVVRSNSANVNFVATGQESITT